ncbi:MAG: LacI family transcriptional regulator, xylobiose transport system transcriptional regulator [Actinomycetota bacterium]|nr:LacI family transcriptional regulator, xylobiose transport system transcriptional regulator [Actinomycetota bacterium]
MAGDADRRVTIARIAERAGVSAPTVSKVLNGRTNIAPGTRARIEQVILEEGYQPRPRKTHRSPVITLVFQRLDSLWAVEIIRGVRERAHAAGFDVLVDEVTQVPPSGADWLQKALSRQPQGIVTVAAGLSEQQKKVLRRSSTPLVALDPSGDPIHGTVSVGAANWSGGYAATRHLIGLGHRHIAAISGPLDIACARARHDGYRAAMDAAGLTVPRRTWSAAFLAEDGRRAALELLDSPRRPTAVVTGNDLQALGVYKAARALGLRIPEDLSVVGFDDLPIADWCVPELTTVRQPLFQMAVAATDLVLDMGRREIPEDHRIEFGTTLVVRKSSTPPGL